MLLNSLAVFNQFLRCKGKLLKPSQKVKFHDYCLSGLG